MDEVSSNGLARRTSRVEGVGRGNLYTLSMDSGCLRPLDIPESKRLRFGQRTVEDWMEDPRDG